ncbi:MAG: hypothetical protein KDK62_02970 [Chlamydiia bacterium]|nr:hypothetical protein [Chlamydiia bacterium]
MTTITKEIPVEHQLLYSAGGVGLTLATIGAQVYAPTVSIPIDIVRELGQRLIFEPVISNEQVTHEHIFRSIVAGTLKATASKVIGKYAFVVSGALECADKYLMGKEVSFQTFCAGTAAGLASKGTSLAFRAFVPMKFENYYRNLDHYINETWLAGAKGATAGSFSQMARNLANGNNIESGVLQAALMGGVTQATQHAFECMRENAHINRLDADYEETKKNFGEKESQLKQEIKDCEDNLNAVLDHYKNCKPNDPKAKESIRNAENKVSEAKKNYNNEKGKVTSASDALHKACNYYKNLPMSEPALQRDYSLPKDVVKRQELRTTKSELRATREQVTTLRAENSRLVSEVRSANTALKDLKEALEQYKQRLEATEKTASEASENAARSHDVLFSGKNGHINFKALREGQKAQKAKASDESESPSAADAAKSPEEPEPKAD